MPSSSAACRSSSSRYLYLIRPTYLHPMLVNPIGWGMLGAACVMMLVGFVWLKKVVKVEV